MVDKTEKFELEKLTAKGVVAFEESVKEQKALVKENPYIKITDNATFQEAKKRRTNLLKGRTKYESQDKTFASFFRNLRKDVGTLIEGVVAISQKAEDKQQAEVKRWEGILEEQRLERQKIEDARIDKITTKIEGVEEMLAGIIDGTTFDSLKDKRDELEAIITKSREFDHEEFIGQFEEMVDRMEKAMKTKAEDLVKAEEERKLNEAKEAEAKINEIYRVGRGILDGVCVENIDGLEAKISELFEIDFANEEFIGQFNSTKKYLFEGVEKAKEGLKEEANRLDREHITAIEDVNLEAIEEADAGSFGAIKQTVEMLLKSKSKLYGSKFDKTENRIKKALERREKSIEKELELQKEADKLEEEKAERLLTERGNQLEALKLVWEDGERPGYVGFGLFFQDENTVEFSNDEWATILAQIPKDIEQFKEADELERKRQKEIAGDKIVIEKILDVGIRSALPTISGAGLGNGEMAIIYQGLKTQLDEWLDGKIAEVKAL